MNAKEVKITPPDGYEIDRENSTLDCIKFKPVKENLTYDGVAKELFSESPTWFNNYRASIKCVEKGAQECYKDANNCTSEKQAQKLLAINKLMNVAKYLNGDWKPDWGNSREPKWSLYIGTDGNIDILVKTEQTYSSNVYFKTKELAKQAKEILGEDTLKLAFSTDW